MRRGVVLAFLVTLAAACLLPNNSYASVCIQQFHETHDRGCPPTGTPYCRATNKLTNPPHAGNGNECQHCRDLNNCEARHRVSTIQAVVENRLPNGNPRTPFNCEVTSGRCYIVPTRPITCKGFVYGKGDHGIYNFPAGPELEISWNQGQIMGHVHMNAPGLQPTTLQILKTGGQMLHPKSNAAQRIPIGNRGTLPAGDDRLTLLQHFNTCKESVQESQKYLWAAGANKNSNFFQNTKEKTITAGQRIYF